MTRPVPATVVTAYRLWLAAIAVGVLSGLVAFFLVDELTAAAGGAPLPELPPDQARTATLLAGLFAVLVAAGFVALAVFVVRRMRAGRSWARLVLTLLGGLTAGYGLLGLGETFALFGAGAAGTVYALLSLVQLVLLVAAIVAMYRRGATEYFS